MLVAWMATRLNCARLGWRSRLGGHSQVFATLSATLASTLNPDGDGRLGTRLRACLFRTAVLAAFNYAGAYA
jgi:hypothetical protein